MTFSRFLWLLVQTENKIGDAEAALLCRELKTNKTINSNDLHSGFLLFEEKKEGYPTELMGWGVPPISWK